jgi:hypothetical protein
MVILLVRQNCLVGVVCAHNYSISLCFKVCTLKSWDRIDNGVAIQPVGEVDREGIDSMTISGQPNIERQRVLPRPVNSVERMEIGNVDALITELHRYLAK